MDKLILSYHDACLYQSDCDILKSDTTWLNDRIISFYFEYLQREIVQNDNILFIGPEVTQAIKMMGNRDDVNAIFLDPLNPSSRSHIIFAINDNSSDKAGGSHWSLCVYSKGDNAFYHFDSSSGSNHSPCSSLVKILKSCLNCEGAELIKTNCLQQNNFSDCGIFVLCHADLICQTIAKGESLSSIKMLQLKKVQVKRNETVQIINSLNKTGSNL